MQIQLTALCDAATDYQGKLCLLGVFDTIQFRQMPGIHPQCFIAMRFVFERSEAGNHTITTSFLNPDGDPISQPINGRNTVVFPPEARFLSSNVIIVLQNLRFEKTGPHSIVVSVDNAQQAAIPLTVRLVTRQVPPTN